MVVQRAAELGRLRPDLTEERAIDALWVLNDPAIYGDLVGGRGWPEDAYRPWLAGQMRAAVLDAAE
jgi:hypothetical protein